MSSTVYLIPCALHDNPGPTTLPYIKEAVQECSVFFVEAERTARRFLKSLWKEMVIDAYEWVTIHKAENSAVNELGRYIREGKNIGIISEAGCPGIADPGQLLVAAAHREGATVKPLVGPSSILLALMASGLNGQQFRFTGYLPVDAQERAAAIRAMETDSRKHHCTQIFIETPYRNNALLQSLVATCQPDTRLCIAVALTSENEWIQTRAIASWKKQPPDLHKRPAIFCLLAAER